MRDRMIDEANLDFEQSQTYLDRASSLERKFGQAYIYISLTDLAKNINVWTKTAWLCRMKIYETLFLWFYPYRTIVHYGLLDFLIAYAIREMYNYKVLVLDTQR